MELKVSPNLFYNYESAVGKHKKRFTQIFFTKMLSFNAKISTLTVIFLLSSLLTVCSAKQPEHLTQMQLLIPLYSYPTWYNSQTYFWPEVVKAAQKVPVTAVINPNNGPGGSPPNQDYVKGLKDLRQDNITILGYVATNYGKRDIQEVKSDIDIYSKYYNLQGIFFDEAASGADKLDYYQEIYNYTKAKPNLDTVVLNQGTHPDEGYLSKPAADIAIIFENYSKEWPNYQPSPYVNNYDPKRFSGLIHTVPDVDTMKSHIDKAVERNIQYIYITDDSPDSPDKDPWNSLPSYWQEEVNYIQSLNQKNQSSK
ncbi:hypothetical protein NO758_00888 [Planktothrix agardhii]|nr:hypothetical protein NO758_00888 [Planktothrix agardhii]